MGASCKVSVNVCNGFIYAILSATEPQQNSVHKLGTKQTDEYTGVLQSQRYLREVVQGG